MDKILKKAKKINLVVFDVDGVLTDGSLILGDDGTEYKIFNVHDGLGLVMLRESGLHVAVISARSSKVVSDRMAELGIKYVFQGQKYKYEVLISLMKDLDVNADQVAFAGDDLVDIQAMSHAGLSIAVANANDVVKKHADWVTGSAGGKGAVREICELILNSQDKLDRVHERYINPV